MQLSLQLADSAPGDELATLCNFLLNRPDWTKAKTITNSLNYSDRQIRALASRSGGLIVSGPGSPGYKHVSRCTGEEVNRICEKLQAQAKLMSSRAGDIRAAFHKTDKRQ